MRAPSLVLATFVLGLGMSGRVARAECWGADDLAKILGVAADGRFLYSRATRSDADERGEGRYQLAIVTPTGERETTITRDDQGAWHHEGKPLPPAILAGKPSPRVLETRLQTLLGATAPLVPTKRDVRIVKGETTYRVFLDRTLVKMMKAGDAAEDPASERSWRARTFAHPTAAIQFVALSSHTQPRQSCKINVESIDWIATSKLDPGDRSVAAAFCDAQLQRDEAKRAPTADEAKDDANSDARLDDGYRPDDPLAQWVVCTKESFGGAYLDRIAARAAQLEGRPRLALLRAVAHTVETAWAPLVRMASSKQPDERAFALGALTRLSVALRKRSLHGDKRDPAFAAALLPELKRLCVPRAQASAPEAAAIAACEAEIAQPSTDDLPEEEPCHPGSCSRQLLGVAADGQFVIEQQRRQLAFELRAPDGQLRLRISDNCKSKGCAMRWDLEGVASAAVLDLTIADPRPDKLRADLVKTLALTPARPSRQPVALIGNLLRIGLWTVATLELDKLATPKPLEHDKSPLLFIDTAETTCSDARCRVVVWGPRPVADPRDFAALAEQCQKRAELDRRADCLGSILDERVYPILIEHARVDDDWQLGQAAARIATALGRQPLFEYATAPDPFRRQWALYALGQVLEDTTERLPFSGRAPDKRRPALLAEIEPVCKRALADRDLIVAGGAIACLAQTTTKIDPARLREVLHSPHLETRATVFAIARREDVLVGPELRHVASWLTEPIDKQQQDYQERLHGEVCALFITKRDPAHKPWLRPLVEARLKTLTLRPDARGACKTLLDLL